MKQLLFLPLLLSFITSHAQSTREAVFQRERQFAAFAVANGMKPAFLAFADSAGVIVDKGRFVNAITTWQNREAPKGILNWHPIFGAMAASGDLAFTTGPWTFQPNTINDSIVAHGQYNTVWHKIATGEWKFLVDLGIDGVKAATMLDALPTSTQYTAGSLESLKVAEEKFLLQTNDTAKRRAVYASNLSQPSFFLERKNQLPATSLVELERILSSMPAIIKYRQQSFLISKSGDLGVVYGVTGDVNRPEGFLRIWRREGNEWKLLLEALPY